VAVAACASGGPSEPPAGTPVPTPPPTVAPTDVPTDEPTDDPTDEPTDEPTDDPGTSAAPGTADACTGTAENREFFALLAAAVSWPVYCPVLPAGWFVESGQYRLANGGRMDIVYRGPGSARLTLREGAFCSESDGCVPPGADSGDASFGDLEGTFVTLDDGGWAIVVDRGARLSWLALGTGVSESAFRGIGEKLALVGD
jgi:hypothetical protein